MRESGSQLKWRRLDNTAKLFPVIANENLSNVFRVSATLKRAVVPELLQQALDDVIPWFDGFRVKLRRGFFWYYFETNKRRPLIERETTYPCKFIDRHSNQMFLFRVSYYDRRINLEVFHVITDGMGAVNFLKELVYRYLELERSNGKAPALTPSPDCILDVEDSYVKNYKKVPHRPYDTRKAFQMKGQQLYLDTVSVIHGYVDLAGLKAAAKAYGVSITKFLAALLIWCIYQEYLNKQACKNPICLNLPVNLRAFFESNTTMNFFAITALSFLSTGEDHTFEEVVQAVSAQMDEKITRERMEELISYNVSNEKKWYLRMVPLPVKWLAMNAVFRRSSRGTTMTLSNLGPIQVKPEFEEDIENFHFVIGVSKRQKMKCGVNAYKDKVVITFTSVLEETYLQRAFFRELTRRGVDVIIESNGVVNEKM